ncbi:MAG: hypothetical protein JXA37_04995 [Chloroflexia bacterium]|nr:hypothetical protein [Chloroflexia bacterium]
MRARDILASEGVIRLGLFLAGYVPRWFAYAIARTIAWLIALFKPEVYWIVRGNLSQILGEEADKDTLHRLASQLFWHASRAYTDFFRSSRWSAERIREELKIVPEDTIENLRGEVTRGRGVLLLGTHMSNFDLVIQAAGAHNLPTQALSLPNPWPGARIFNELREQGSVEITPISPSSLRSALRRLKHGGVVLLALDRPIPEDRELIEFLGRPAYLPTGPARMALMSGALVYTGACHYEDGEGYVLEIDGPIDMVRSGDRQQDVLTNARRLAAMLEKYVQAHPEQWLMFHPFWPEEAEPEPIP